MIAPRRTFGFLLPTVEVRGRVRVVLRTAQALAEAGDLVFVIVRGAASLSEWPFLEGRKVGFAAIEPSDARGIRFDAVFATAWDTLGELGAYRARTHALLAQGIEDRLDDSRGAVEGERATSLDPGLAIVCTSRALRAELVSAYGIDPERAFVIPLPLDAGPWAAARAYVRKTGRTRFLVQGRPSDRSRHVARTLSLLEAAGVEYAWVGVEVDRRLAGPGCVRILENVPHRDMPAVFASADVLVHLSDAYDVPSSLLEMFATGGTAIVWDAPGVTDYVTHRHDAWVCPRHSDEAVVEALKVLDRDREALERLVRGARRTARSLPPREAQDAALVELVRSLVV